MDVTAISWEFIKPFDASEDDPFCAVAITSWADDGEYLEYTVGIEDASKTLSEYKHGMDCTKALYALFAFLKKKILVAERSESRPRAQRRAAEWTDPPDVFVIIYRKAASRPRETGESSPVDWSCRWLSREHWGIRYHGGGDQRVPVVTLISASIKGPEGKPMRVSPQTMGAIIR